jgi:hypothetical protein
VSTCQLPSIEHREAISDFAGRGRGLCLVVGAGGVVGYQVRQFVGGVGAERFVQ